MSIKYNKFSNFDYRNKNSIEMIIKFYTKKKFYIKTNEIKWKTFIRFSFRQIF